MYYPEEIIEEVRVQNEIVDVISEYVTLTQKGNSHFGLCPFHNEKTPSFSVSREKQMYYCFGCGAGGNVITFIMQKENYNFIETIQLLAQRRNIVLPEAQYSESAKKEIQKKQLLFDMHKDAARYFYYNLKNDSDSTVRDYLNNRNISLEIQKKFGLGFANGNHYSLYNYLKSKNYEEDLILESGLVLKSKNRGNCYDRFTDRLMFPIFDVHGRIIAFGGRVLDNSQPKYLNSPDTALFDKSTNLYGLNYARVSRKNELFIVEGYMDVIAMYQAGFHNTVASLGTAFTSGHASLIKRYAKEVILLYDSDEAGVRATLRAIPILQSANIKVRVLHLPNQQDPDDYIAKNGAGAMEKLAENAMGAVTFQILIIKQKYDINDVEQKIRFIEEVATLISELQNAVEQEIYTKQISTEYKIDIDALKTEIRKKIGEAQNRNISFSKKRFSSQSSKSSKIHIQDGYFKTQAELLQLMCLYPNILKKVKPYLAPEEFVDPFFQKLVSLIYEKQVDGVIQNPSQFANYFDTPEDQNKVANIFLGQKKYESNEMITKAINDTVKRLKTRVIQEQLKVTTDAQKLQNLLKAKKELDKLYIEGISG